jgi:hypothetical protein
MIRVVFTESGFFPSRIRISDPGVKTALRIQESKKHCIPNPDSQHWNQALFCGFTSCIPGFPETVQFHNFGHFWQKHAFSIKATLYRVVFKYRHEPRRSPEKTTSKNHKKSCENMKTTSFGKWIFCTLLRGVPNRVFKPGQKLSTRGWSCSSLTCVASNFQQLFFLQTFLLGLMDCHTFLYLLTYGTEFYLYNIISSIKYFGSGSALLG